MREQVLQSLARIVPDHRDGITHIWRSHRGSVEITVGNSGLCVIVMRQEQHPVVLNMMYELGLEIIEATIDAAVNEFI